MTVELDLTPELERQARARAAVHGVSLEAYLLSVIEEAALPATSPEATREEFEAAMDVFSEGTEALPVLPEEAFSRNPVGFTNLAVFTCSPFRATAPKAGRSVSDPQRQPDRLADTGATSWHWLEISVVRTSTTSALALVSLPSRRRPAPAPASAPAEPGQGVPASPARRQGRSLLARPPGGPQPNRSCVVAGRTALGAARACTGRATGAGSPNGK